MLSDRVGKSAYVLAIIVLAGLNLAGAPAPDSPFPWEFGGYEKIDNLHLRYWSAARDAFGDARNFVEPGFRTEIAELWFSKSMRSLRVDKYVEKSTMKCNQFKGKAWETIEENGIEYVLWERVIQTGTTREQWFLENIESGGGKELCEYKWSEGPRAEVESVRSALSILSMIPYLAYPENEEIAVSSLELDEVMNPDKYKATLLELKKTYEKAGRKTAKYETGHGIIKFRTEGYAFVDLEYGLGLEGYLTKVQDLAGQAGDLTAPVCIYKVLSIDTKIVDPGVFDMK